MVRFLTCSFLLQSLSWSQNYQISTVAGIPQALGDSATSQNARFGIVSAVAMGPDGSVYVADAAFHQVRRIAPDGKISLFAGGKVRGFAGDYGPATSALLDTPTALAVDGGGQVFIGDSGNHRVRVVTVYGNIQTVAGNGQVAPSPAQSPVLPGEGGPATAAPLNQISGIAFSSSGDLLIADIGNNRIFRVGPNGNIHTIAGNATTAASLADQPALTATLSAPAGVAADVYGNIFFAEQKTGTVREIDPKGNMTRILGTGAPNDSPISSGPPLSYPLQSPMALVADNQSHLYIAEANRITVYTPAAAWAGTMATAQAIAGDVTQKSPGAGDGGSALAAGIAPKSLAVDAGGNLFVADSVLTLDFHNRIRRIAGGFISGFAGGNVPSGKGDNGPAASAELYFPRAIAIDPSGTLYIADTGNNRVRAVTSDGRINTIAGTGHVGNSGDQGSATLADLNAPQGLALDSTGNLYVSDGTRVRQISPSGTINTFAGGGTSTQEGSPALSTQLVQTGSLAVDSQNNLYIDQLGRISQVSVSNQTVSTVAGTGVTGYSGDNGPATSAQIDDVAGVALDSNGNLYIADEDNNRVRRVDASGNITTFAGGGTSLADGANATDAALNIPLGVAVDGNGNVYIAEYGGNRVRVVSAADGTIRTIAGNGLQGYSGDGGLATNASLNGPVDVKVDAQGNVYIADLFNSVIRKLTPGASPPSPAIISIGNGGSLSNGPVAPGERVVLTGTALGPNAKVTFGSTSAPVLSSSFTSALVVVPYEVAGQSSVPVTITTSGVSSAPFTAMIAPSAPGVFTVSGTGQGQAIAFGENGLLNSPDNPAVAGSMLAVVCTGGGLVNPALPTGVPVSNTPPSPVLPVSATVGGMNASIDQAYSIPGTIGQFVVDLRIPDQISSNSGASLQIMVGNAVSQAGVSVAVREAPSDDSGADSQTVPLTWYRMSGRRSLPDRHPAAVR